MRRRIAFALLFFFLSLFSMPFSQSLSQVSLSYDWLSSGWEPLTIIALFISLLILTLAYMASIGLDMPPLKAWSAGELSQVFTTALIIISLIAVFNFISSTTLSLVEEGEFACTPQAAEPYAVSVAKCYLDSLLSLTDSSMKSASLDAIENAKKASEREGKSTNSIYSLWYAYFNGKNAGYSIYTDRYSYDFEVLSGIYTSLYAQKVFLQRITSTSPAEGWSIASVLLFYGVILRTFFFSRKLGGLLLAIGIGLLLVWPLTYSLSWFTLKVAVFGDQMVAPLDDYCPIECTYEPPKNYISEGTTPPCNGACSGAQDYFDSEGKGVCPNNGNECTTGAICGTAVCPVSGVCPYTGASCIYPPTYPPTCTIPCFPHEGTFSCPSMCRELPYPVQNPGCTNSTLLDESEDNYGYMAEGINVRAICASCPDECKVGGGSISTVTPTEYTVPYRERTTCYSNDALADPVPEVELLFGETACEKTDNPDVYSPTNPSATNAYLSSCYTEGCSIKHPENYNSPSCSDSCSSSCPDFCRVYYYDSDDPTNQDKWRIPSSEDFQLSGGEEWTACDACTETQCGYSCRFGMPDPKRLDCQTLCADCPPQCRVQGLLSSAFFGTNCNTPVCNYNDVTNEGCPAYCKLSIPAEGTSITETCDPGRVCPDNSLCSLGSTCPDGSSCPSPSPADCQLPTCPGTSQACYPGSECPNNQVCPQATRQTEAVCADYPAVPLPSPTSNTCSACPKECRVGSSSSINCPDSCSDQSCSPDCKSPYSPQEPPSLCDSCLDCDDDCTTAPQIRTNCVELCNLPNSASRDFTPAGFVSTGGAQTTMSDTKNAGMLAVPAIVLPLFNIVITLAFIRVLSQTLGGDVEIPGIARII